MQDTTCLISWIKPYVSSNENRGSVPDVLVLQYYPRFGIDICGFRQVSQLFRLSTFPSVAPSILEDLETMSQVLVDDQDPRVVYTGAWEHDASTAEYGRTKSGASPAGLTANLNFTGWFYLPLCRRAPKTDGVSSRRSHCSIWFPRFH